LPVLPVPLELPEPLEQQEQQELPVLRPVGLRVLPEQSFALELPALSCPT